jgi:chromosome segregation ATPase
VTTGVAKAADVDAAKAHLAALHDQLSTLESAWAGAQANAQRQRTQANAGEFERVMAEIEQHLAERELALTAVMGAADTIRQALTAYRSASQAIRTKVVPLHGNVGNELRNLQEELNRALAFDQASTVVGALSQAFAANTVTDWRKPFGDRTAAEFESRMADKVRRAAGQFAPQDAEA